MTKQEHPQFGAENQEVPPLSRHIDTLLSSQEVAQLPEGEQGRAIMDQFVGILVRQGNVTTADGHTVTPKDILTTLDDLGTARLPSGLLSFTRQKGIRQAVEALSKDPRTGQLIGAIGRDILRYDDNGNILLSTENQIEGYLQSGEDTQLDPTDTFYDGQWKEALRDKIRDVIDKGHVWGYDPNKGPIESDNDFLRKSGIAWMRTFYTAEGAGVDMRLLGKSAELIARRKKIGRDIGIRTGALTVIADSETGLQFSKLWEP